MFLDDKITKEAYDVKYNELTRIINQAKGERALYSANVETIVLLSQGKPDDVIEVDLDIDKLCRAVL